MAAGYRTVGRILVAAALLVQATGCSTAPTRVAQPPLSAVVGLATPNATTPVKKDPPVLPSMTSGQVPITGLTVRWEAGLDPYLLLYGTTSLPHLQVQIQADSQVISQVDVKTKDGTFLATLRDPGPGVQADLVLYASGPNSPELARLPVPQERRVGAAWSRRFARVIARRLDAQTVFIAGEAQPSDATFTAQVRVNGSVLSEQPVRVSKGLFEAKLSVTDPLPKDGIEALILVPSAHGDPDQVELSTRVLGSQ